MILVTGATGLVGSHLLLYLTQNNETLRATHREGSDLKRVEQLFSQFLPSQGQNLFSRIQWVLAELNDIPALEEAFEGITQVYHCAAKVSFDSAQYWALRKININGTANVVNLCISNKIDKLLYVSSIATLDSGLGDKIVTESSAWNQELPHNQYAISKYGGEMEVWRASQEGVPVIIVNPGVIIGPGFWNSASGMMFTQIHKGLKYTFPKVTGFVGVNDVVKATIQLMESDIENEQYVLVSENTSFAKILKSVASTLGKPEPLKQLKPWMIYLGWLYQCSLGRLLGQQKNLTRSSYKNLFQETLYSSQKIKDEFNFEFEPIDQVIHQTGHIFLENSKISP